MFEKVEDYNSEVQNALKSNSTEKSKQHSLKELWSSNTDLNRESDHYRVCRTDRTGNSVTYIVQVHFQQLFFDRQKCVTITINDITSVERNVALKAKNKMLNTMQASISHELLTPLKCIKSITELMKEEHEYDKQLCENLETIDTSVQLVFSQINKSWTTPSLTLVGSTCTWSL